MSFPPDNMSIEARRVRAQKKRSDQAQKFMAPLELTPEKHQEFQKKAMERFIVKQYEKAIQEKFESGDIATQDETMLALAAYTDQRKESSSTHFMVTINLDPKFTWEQLHVKVQKAIKKKWVTYWMYAIEQRSESAPAHGFHAHIIFARNDYEVSRCRKELTNTFRKLVGNVKAIKFHPWVNTEQGLLNIQNYVMGKKKSEKLAKVEYDKVWRASVALDDYYCSSKPNL